MNGRIAKLIRKDAEFEPHNPTQRRTATVNGALRSGPQRTMYKILKREYVYGKAQRKAEAVSRRLKQSPTTQQVV